MQVCFNVLYCCLKFGIFLVIDLILYLVELMLDIQLDEGFLSIFEILFYINKDRDKNCLEI